MKQDIGRWVREFNLFRMQGCGTFHKTNETFDVCRLIALGLAGAYFTTGEVVNTGEFTLLFKRRTVYDCEQTPFQPWLWTIFERWHWERITGTFPSKPTETHGTLRTTIKLSSTAYWPTKSGLLYFIVFYFISFHFILFCFILFYPILFYFCVYFRLTDFSSNFELTGELD